MPAGVHLLGEAAYQRHLKATHRVLGLCRLCSQPAAEREDGTKKRTCQRHIDYLATWKSGVTDRLRRASKRWNGRFLDGRLQPPGIPPLLRCSR